jgi:hypothetical protein
MLQAKAAPAVDASRLRAQAALQEAQRPLALDVDAQTLAPDVVEAEQDAEGAPADRVLLNTHAAAALPFSAFRSSLPIPTYHSR